MEYSPELLQRSQALAGRFDALSVREASGVGLAQQLWGRHDVLVHVDPTMLLSSERYLELVTDENDARPPAASGSLVFYVLD